jgi:hypothetical protein
MPPTRDSQEGIKGNTQGDKKEKSPAVKARGTEILPFIKNSSPENRISHPAGVYKRVILIIIIRRELK